MFSKWSDFVKFFVLILVITAASFVAADAAVFTVNSTADTGGNCLSTPNACTFRQAINSLGFTDDTINFDPTVFNAANCPPSSPCQITTGFSFINGRRFTVNGPGARILTINTGSDTLFQIQSNSAVTIRNVSITGDGGNLLTVAPFGVNSLTLENVRAFGINGGSFVFSANAQQTVTVNNCLFHDNALASAPPSVFLNYGILRISNSTFTNNVYSNGGAINNQSGDVLLTNVTISGNGNASALSGGGIISFSPAANFRIRNSIIAGNRVLSAGGGYDLSGSFTSLGNNIIGITDGSSGFANGVGGDLAGTFNAPLNPQLSALENNGGETNVLRLLPNSPAIDAGNNCVLNLSCPTDNPLFAVTTDQRGAPRPQGARVDIGAFEGITTTSAAVTIGGRVLAADQGVSGATVTLTNQNGDVRRARTGSFGYYYFENVTPGELYIVSATHRRYNFTPQVVTITENLTDLNFNALF